QEKPRHTEIGISVFNTSVLTSGMNDDKRWLFSARRGNLDLVIDPKFGQPSYYDVFGEFAVDVTPNTTFSINALYADDRVKVVVESDPDELEQVLSITTNAQVWGQLETRWSDSLTSSTVLSATFYENLRAGSMNDPEKIIGVVRDEREIDQFSLRQDWSWHPSDAHFVQWGLQGSWGDAWYDYAGSAQYFGLMALFEGQSQSMQRTASAAPEGGSIALFLSDRWRLSPRTTLEWGLRWDDQTYTELRSDAQMSPRINLLYALNDKTELRLTWGLYHQSQRIQELQIEDGITNFWPAERSDHIIVGLRKLLAGDLSLRVEAFYKDMSRVRPRFENLYDPLGIIPEFLPDRIAIAPESARSAGLEISLDRSVGDWDWWASYTVAQATDRIRAVNEARSWDQRHAFQGGVTWTDERWTASIAGSVHSGWPATNLSLEQTGFDPSGEPIYVAIPGPRNVLQHNTFASVDARISRKFDVKYGSLTAFVEVSNLLNRRNVCCIDWDVTDDDFGNLELEHSNDYWLPLLPAIGVLWEF
ncbi:MAG: TonB-dependent receptor, partial [Gammaproteobacteria bacterium]|nr:TonB-dependent receptor [Gammaproteobacteria bacterium]